MDFLKFFTNNIVLKKLEIRMASWKKMFEFYRNILKKTLIDCTYFFFPPFFFFFFRINFNAFQRNRFWFRSRKNIFYRVPVR